MVRLTAFFGAVAGLFGAMILYMALAMPRGPWMVVVSSLVAFFSFFFGPYEIVPNSLKTYRNEVSAGAKIVTKGAFFVNAKMSNIEGHVH